MNDSDTNTLAGKVTLVTGANRGIGAELCKGLARAGATVVAACRKPESAQDLVNAILENGGTAVAQALEVSEEASWRQSRAGHYPG